MNGSGNSASSAAATPLVGKPIGGVVRGGQQPIAGAQVQLYAAGTMGTGSAARAMLAQPVPTTAGGNFTLTSYTCNAGDQVYLVGMGGDAGAGPNSAIALMAALGPCATLQANAATTFISVNEVTTVGSVFAIAPFMKSIANVGSDSAHKNALAAAFANTQTMVNTSNGSALATSTGNGIVPQATIDALANSIASCINSQPGDNACPDLFSQTAGSAGTPADTIAATLNVALNPTANASAIWLLGSGTPPFMPTLPQAPSTWALTVQHPSDVPMYHNDISRSGAQTYEQTLTPGNVNATQFGKLFTFPVDSYLYAQPLYVGGIGMPDGAVRNLVMAASSRGTVYAFDADGNNPAAGYLWSVNYIPSGERYAAAADYSNCGNPEESGIVGTPVIDRPSQTMYFVVKSVTSSGAAVFYHRLHAVSLIDGSEQPGSPTVISPTFTGTGQGAVGGKIAFNGQRQNNRSALLLTTNSSGVKTVWVAYASHCDIGPYHGLLLGFDGSSLAATAIFNNTPNGGDGGFWGSSGGPAADAQGNIFELSGNGTFDSNTGGTDYGDTALRLAPPASGASSTLMTVTDSFTPSNQATLDSKDLDLGGSEPLLFTDSASGVAPNLMIAGDKNGYLYLLNRDNLGKYNTGSNGIDGTNGDLQDWGGNSTFIYNYSFFNNVLYTGTPMHAYAFTPGTATTAGSFNTTPIASYGHSNDAPVVSANGTSNALVWILDGVGGLSAYTPLLSELYSTGYAAGGAQVPPTYVKFSSPVIANGKVYVSGQGGLAVYGLLP
jgi:hypothetical protein